MRTRIYFVVVVAFIATIQVSRTVPGKEKMPLVVWRILPFFLGTKELGRMPDP